MDNMINYENVQYINFEVNESCNLISTIADSSQYDFVQVVAGVDKVRKAVCYNLASGEVLVGVLTEPLFSLSERLSLKQQIEQTVAEITQKDVFVTLDTDLFVQISKCKEEQTAQEIKKLIYVRNMARM